MNLSTDVIISLVQTADSIGAPQVWVGTMTADARATLAKRGYIMGTDDERGGTTVYFIRESSLND